MHVFGVSSMHGVVGSCDRLALRRRILSALPIDDVCSSADELVDPTGFVVDRVVELALVRGVG